MVWMIFGALLIGMALGLLGSGGSILTVPILHYLLGHSASQSAAESLAIVGTIALVTATLVIFQRQVDWRSVLLFGFPGMGGTVVGAWLGANWFSGFATLLLFAIVMLTAARFMLRPQNSIQNDNGPDGKAAKRKGAWIGVEGFVVGIVTGVIGVGGGFLIVPALVVWGRLSMERATGTSLVIVTLKCVVGFAEYQYEFARSGQQVDWSVIAIFSVVGIVSSLCGRSLAVRMDPAFLRKLFGWLLILIAVAILVRELYGSLVN